LAFIASHRLAVADPVPQADLGGLPAAYVWSFRHDGVFDGGIWSASQGAIPPGARPVTAPAERVAQWRRAAGHTPSDPVYAVPEPRLRLWPSGGSWFVDDRRLTFGGPPYLTFRWQFGTLAEAVEAMVHYLRQQLGEACSS
jgi:hypothetical protein